MNIEEAYEKTRIETEQIFKDAIDRSKENLDFDTTKSIFKKMDEFGERFREDFTGQDNYKTFARRLSEQRLEYFKAINEKRRTQ